MAKRNRTPEWWSAPRDGLDFITAACWTDAYQELRSPYRNGDEAIRVLATAKFTIRLNPGIHLYAGLNRDFPISLNLEFDEHGEREYVVRVGSFSSQLRGLIFAIGGSGFPIPNNRAHPRTKRAWVQQCLESFVVRKAIREVTE